MIDGQPYLYAFINDFLDTKDESVKLLGRARLGTQFSLYKISDEILFNTQHQFKQLTEKFNNSILGFLHINCVVRYSQLSYLKQLQDYETLFIEHPNIGFLAHGEFYINYINYTSTLLCFVDNSIQSISHNRTVGEIYKLIQILFNEVAKGNAMTFLYIRTKLLLKGIDPDLYGPTTVDPPELLAILQLFTDSIRGEIMRQKK